MPFGNIVQSCMIASFTCNAMTTCSSLPNNFLLKVNVAVKCLRAWNDKAFIQMQMDFIKEANAMSLLDHPHIIKLYGIVLSTPMMLVSLYTEHCKSERSVSALRMGLFR